MQHDSAYAPGLTSNSDWSFQYRRTDLTFDFLVIYDAGVRFHIDCLLQVEDDKGPWFDYVCALWRFCRCHTTYQRKQNPLPVQ